MTGVKRTFTSPQIQAFIFFILVFVIYILLTKPQDKVRDLVISGNKAYLTLGSAGIQIIDVSDESNPYIINSFDTPGTANQLAINDKYLYIADGENGLSILSIDDQNNLQLISQIDTPGYAEDVAIVDKRAYIADGKSGIQIIDISKPDKPVILTEFKPCRYSYRIFHSQASLFLADRNKQLWILDISNPNSPTQKSLIKTDEDVLGITLRDNHLFLAIGSSGLSIFDIATIESPVPVGAYNDLGITNSVAVSGQYAYLANSRAGIDIIEIINPSKPTRVGRSIIVNDGIDIAVRNNNIFVADGYEGLRILDQNIQLSFELLSPETQPGNVRDVAVNQKYAYLASESQGIRVLDISNPQEPKEVGLFDTPEQAIGVTASGDYIYVADGAGDLRILFISNFDENSVELAEKSHRELAGESQDIFVDGKYGYVAAGNAGLRVVNLEDPASPKEVGSEERAVNALAVAVMGDYAYVASGINGLQIVNISDKTKPAVIGSLDTDGEANAIALIKAMISGERTYALVADGLNGLRVIDVTDPYQPREVGANREPKYAYDVIVSDPLAKYVYVSGRSDGLWVMDVSDPTNPTEVGFLDTPGEAHGLDYLDSKVFIANNDRGMQIVDVTNPISPNTIGFYDIPRQVGDVVVTGNAYLIDSGRGLRVVDVEDPKKPREIGFYDTPGHSRGLAIRDDYAYMGAENSLKILDISSSTSPKEISSFGIPMPVTAVAIAGEYAYVANGDGGLRLVKITDPALPGSAGTYDTPGSATDVFIAGNYAYIADGSGGASIVNVSDPNNPQTTSLLNQIKDGRGVLVIGNFAYIASGQDGLFVFNVTKPAAPEQVNFQDTPGIALDLAAVDDFLFLADGSDGIRVFYILQREQLVPVGSYQPSGESVALDVIPVKSKEGEPRHFNIFIASNELGMQIVDASQSMAPIQIGLFNTPGIYPIGKTLTTIPKAVFDVITGHWDEIPDKFWDSIQTYMFDLLVFVVTLVFWMGFVAQFVLPVESIDDRMEAFGRLFSYISGRLSAALVVKEGVVYLGPEKSKSETAEEFKKTNPSVVMVDASSAAILQKYPKPYSLLMQFLLKPIFRLTNYSVSVDPKPNKKNIRIEGPGLVFTKQRGFPANPKYAERIIGTADLRPQVRVRLKVNGFTHDGIEVRTNVVTVFSIGDPPAVLHVGYAVEEKADNIRVILVEERIEPLSDGSRQKKRVKFIKEFSDELDKEDKEEIHRTIQSLRGSKMASNPYQERTDIGSGSVFSVDTRRIFAAVYSQAYDTQEQRYLDWTELPPYAAVEVFRNMLVQELYDSLYMPKDPDDFPLSRLRGTFSKKVRNLGILGYQYVQRRDDHPLEVGQTWDEDLLSFYPLQELHYPKVLRTRGIRILFAGFSGLEPTSEKVKDRMLDFWGARWEQEVEITSASYDLDAMRIRNLARAQAQSEMILALAQILQQDTISQEAMAVLVFQALESAAADSRTNKLLPGETITMLRTLHSWLISGRGEPPSEAVSPTLPDPNQPPSTGSS